MDNLKEYVKNAYNSGKTNREITQGIMERVQDITPSNAYNKLRYILDQLSNDGLVERRQNGKKSSDVIMLNPVESKEQDFDKLSQSMSINKDGSSTLEKVIALSATEKITPSKIMVAHGLDSHLWDVISYTSNYWQSQVKGGEKLDLYQTKITVKPKRVMELSFDDIDRYFDGKDLHIPKSDFKPIEYHTSGDSLVIKVPDLHVGLLAWEDECGNNYDLKIAKENFLYCISDVVRRCKGKEIKKIYFVTLGDILHVDNDNQTTTKGTFQQTDGRMAKIVDCALNMFVEAIEMLRQIAPIKYIYTSGNHDRVNGYMLAKIIANRYYNNDNIEFDLLPNPLKMQLLGNTLLFFHHGDTNNKNLEEAAYNFGREYISAAKWIELNVGHLHTEESKHKYGINIRHMPAMCNSSHWEHQQLYPGDNRCMVCDVYNDDLGRIETWQSNL